MEAGSEKLSGRRKSHDFLAYGGVAAAIAVTAVVKLAPGLITEPVQDGAKLYERAQAALSSDPSPRIDTRVFSNAQLEHMPQKPIVVHKGDGIYTIIQRANRGNDIFSDGPAITAEYKYIENQAPHGVLQPGEVVQVPEIAVISELP